MRPLALAIVFVATFFAHVLAEEGNDRRRFGREVSLPKPDNKAAGHKHLEDTNFGAERWAHAPHFTKRVKRGDSEFDISYVMINGVNFSEPDIALSPKFIAEVEAHESINAQQHHAALLEGRVKSPRPDAVDLDLLGVVVFDGGLWKCPVPFRVNDAFPEEHRQKIYDAIDQLRLLTRWDFDEIIGNPSETQSDFIEFMHNTEGACYSYVGRQGGRQEVHVSEFCGVGSTVHEILHAFGVLHEHTRADRDDYVKVHFDNISPSLQHNYDVDPLQRLIGDYDYGSIMHYPLGEYMTLKQDVSMDTCVVGQRAVMSKTDVLAAMSRWTPSETCGSDSSPPSYVTFCNETTINLCGHVGINSDYMGHYLLHGIHDNRPYYKELDGTAFLFWRTVNFAWLLSNTLGSSTALGYAPANADTPDLIGDGQWRMWNGTSWMVSVEMTTGKCSSSDAGIPTPSAPPTAAPYEIPVPTPMPLPLPTPRIANLPIPMPTSLSCASPIVTSPSPSPAPPTPITPTLVPSSMPYPASAFPSTDTSLSFTHSPNSVVTSNPSVNSTGVSPVPVPTEVSQQGNPACFSPDDQEFHSAQQWTCCSPLQPCPQAVGHCRRDSDCQGNLVCGHENCGDIWGSDSPYDALASCCDAQYRITVPLATTDDGQSRAFSLGHGERCRLLPTALICLYVAAACN